MRQFNAFIDSANLMETPLQNGKFTWSREGGTAANLCWTDFLLTVNGMMILKTQE